MADNVVCLLNVAEDKYELNHDALEILNKITGSISVIATAGPARTGKSSLLNLLGAPSFTVGSSVQPCTQGIWMWISPEKVGDTTIIFLDSEGTGSVQKDETHDARVFALTLLLSSMFIYNSAGPITEQALEQLSLIAQLTKHIHTKTLPPGQEEDEGDSFAEFFPHFLWILRDFALRLQMDSAITADQYLEDSLRPQQGFSESVQTKNRIRIMLATFFKNRHCIPLVRPLEEESDLQQGVNLGNARREFVEGIHKVKETVFGQVKRKMMNGLPVTGTMLAELAKTYVDSINAGSIPVLADAWTNMVKIQNEKAIDDAFEIYKKSGVWDAKGSMLQPIHEEANGKALAAFAQAALGDDTEQFRAKLRQMIRTEHQKVLHMKEVECEREIQQLMQQEHVNIRKHIQDIPVEALVFDRVIGQIAAAVRTAREQAWAPLGMKAIIDHCESGAMEIIIEVQKMIHSHLNQIHQLEIDKKNEAFHKQSVELMQLNSKNQLLTENIEKLTIDNENLKTHHKEVETQLQHRIASLEKQLQDTTEEAEREKTQLTAQITDLSSKIKELNTTLREASEKSATEIAKLEEANQLANRRGLDLERQLNESKTQNEQLNQKYVSAVETHKNEISSLQKAFDEERENLRKEIELKQQKSQQEFSDVSSQLSTLKLQYQNETEQMKLDLGKLRKEKEEREREMSEQQRIASQQIATLQNQIQESVDESSSTQSKADATIRSLNTSLAVERDRSCQLEQQLRMMAMKIEDKEREIHDKHKELSQLEEKLEDANENLQAKEGFEEARDAMKTRLEELDTQLRRQHEAFKIREDALTQELNREVKAREALEVRLAEVKLALGEAEFEAMERQYQANMEKHTKTTTSSSIMGSLFHRDGKKGKKTEGDDIENETDDTAAEHVEAEKDKPKEAKEKPKEKPKEEKPKEAKPKEEKPKDDKGKEKGKEKEPEKKEEAAAAAKKEEKSKFRSFLASIRNKKEQDTEPLINAGDHGEDGGAASAAAAAAAKHNHDHDHDDDDEEDENDHNKSRTNAPNKEAETTSLIDLDDK